MFTRLVDDNATAASAEICCLNDVNDLLERDERGTVQPTDTSMHSPITGQMALSASSTPLIQNFLDAVRDRKIDRSQVFLAQLGQQAVKDAALVPWHRYFEGILANERDHDLAAAERIFLELLDETASVELELQGRLCLALAVTYRRQNRLEECVAICQRSLPIYTALDDVVGEAKALKQIVIAYVTGFDQAIFGVDVLPAAVELCQRALALLSAAPATNEIQWLKGTLWNEIGALHRVRQEWELAVEAYQHYRDIHLASGYRFGAGLAEGNLGEIYLKQGEHSWAAARDSFTIALESAREFSDRGHELEALANLAYLEQQQGCFEDAMERYRQAIALIGTLRAGVSSETARTGFFATVTETFANAVLTAQAASQVDLAFAWCEQARARSFLDLLASGTDDIYRLAADTLSTSQVQTALATTNVLLAYFTTGLRETVETRGRKRYDRHRFPPAKTLLFAVTGKSIEVFDIDLSPNDVLP
ncbi:MAG: tetratricopeptide repeat protein, partial [Anaerolineae bacterium]|nr:tetratricopeptide repeat protein [Anaerolineae bacterium]